MSAPGEAPPPEEGGSTPAEPPPGGASAPSSPGEPSPAPAEPGAYPHGYDPQTYAGYPGSYPQQPYAGYPQVPGPYASTQGYGATPAYGPAAAYAAPAEDLGPPFRPIPPFGVLAGLGIIALIFVLSIPFGQHWNFLTTGLEVVPFAVLAFFAYLGRRLSWALVLAYLGLAVLLSLIGMFAFGLTAISLAPGAGGASRPPVTMAPNGLNQIGGVILASLLALAAATVMVLPPVVKALARWLPIDPKSPVHSIALATIVGFTVLGIGQLIATEGRPVLLTLVKNQPDVFNKTTVRDLAMGMVFGLMWGLPGSMVATGWPLVRPFRETLERLGVVKISLKQVGGGILMAVAMVAVFSGLDIGLNAFWEWTRWPKTDAGAFEQLLKPLITPGGALLIGVTAGIGEEVVVRGVLQPRLGIVLPNLFFTSLHAFQYGFDGLLSVFIAGLVLGLIRKRTNTTTSALVHGTYDFILVFYSWFFASG